MPFGWVPIIAPVKPAACASRSTSAARAPSCSGTVASGTKRGSAFAAASRCVVDQPRPGAPSCRRQLVAEHVEPAADHLPVDLLLVHPFRGGAGRSLSGFDTGRVGLPPANENAEAAAVLDQAQRREASRARLRIASSRLGGTRWAWQSMIMWLPPSAVCLVARPRSRRRCAEMRIGSLLNDNAERRDAVVDRARDRGGRAEIAAFARALLAEHGEAATACSDARSRPRGTSCDDGSR